MAPIPSGSLIALCLAAVFACAILPWSMTVAYRRRHISKLSAVPTKVVGNANSYRHYRGYTGLVVFWALAISVYITVLDRAINDPSFMGAKGSKSRNTNFEILLFIRTAFAIVHLPLMTTVLAATVPFWTMAKVDQSSPESVTSQHTNESNPWEKPTKVTKLFYLADKTWSGLIGWITACAYGGKEGGLSYTWAMLAFVAALSYAGFPLLSLAYITTSTQYWESSTMPATIRLGGLESSYSNALAATQDTNQWMKSENILNTTLSPSLVGFNSSITSETPYGGIANLTYEFPWADNQTFITLSPNTAENKQMPVAGMRAFASCELKSYNFTNNLSGNETSVLQIPDLEFEIVDPNSNNGLLYNLRCANNCSNPENSSIPTCTSRSSTVNLTSFDYQDESGYIDGSNDFDKRYSFSNVGSTSLSQTLSCVQQTFDDFQSVASLLLAVQGPENSTRVAECNISVTYLRPTVNTLIKSYIESTGSSSTDIILDASPLELLNLSMASFIDFFHEGPPILSYAPAGNVPVANCSLPVISKGFDWISDWKPPCNTEPEQAPIKITSKPADLLTGLPNYSEFVSGVSSFDERMFLGPLASLVNAPAFFENGYVAGVAFKTETGLSYGRVPPILAVLVLALPVLSAIALSVIASTQRRWTASLDAFAMFKLGTGWREQLQDFQLSSLGKASEQLKSVPGTIVINPAAGTVELGRPQRRPRPSRNGDDPG